MIGKMKMQPSVIKYSIELTKSYFLQTVNDDKSNDMNSSKDVFWKVSDAANNLMPKTVGPE